MVITYQDNTFYNFMFYFRPPNNSCVLPMSFVKNMETAWTVGDHRVRRKIFNM